MTPEQSYEFALLLLCIYREASSEPDLGKHAVGWVIKNRVAHPSWMGSTYTEVILKPSQFSSFNVPTPSQIQSGKIDLNSFRFPLPATDPAYGPCLLAAKHVYEGTTPDPTMGAIQYYADYIPEPVWAKDFIHTVKIGRHFFLRSKS